MDEVLLQFQIPELIIQLEYMLRIVIASVLGLVIGIERKNRNKSAGIRTHAIVALGAALMMVVSKYGFADVEKADASRVAAQVVIIVQFVMHKITYFSNVAAGGYIRLSIVQREDAVQNMARHLKKHKVDIIGTKINKNKKGEIKLEFDVVYPPGFDRDELRAKLVEME